MILDFEKNSQGKDVAFFELHLDDFRRYQLLKHKIENELVNSNTLELFIEFTSILKPTVSEEENWKYLNDVGRFEFEVVEYCKKNKNYFFTDAVIVEEYSAFNNEVISLNIMVREAIMKTMDYLKITKKYKKEDLVGVCYNSLQDYKIRNEEIVEKKEVSHYKLTVITGLILFLLKPDSFKKFKDFTLDPKQTAPEDIKYAVIAETNKFVLEHLKRK